MTDKIHRTFHYDPDSGRSTPVEEVKLENGDKVLVPVQLNEKGEKVNGNFSKKSDSNRNSNVPPETT